jgi:steroid delta-isomerase-like uncharacterized protein
MSLTEDFMAAWNRRDGDALAGLFADDGVYADAALGETMTGRDAIKEFLENAYAEFSSDLRFEPGFAVETASGYAVAWTMKGTHDQDGPQLPKTGKAFSVEGVSLGEVRDGKITRNVDYWSLATFLRQIGVMPAPAGATA